MSEGNYKKEVKNIVINCMVEDCTEKSGGLNDLLSCSLILSIFTTLLIVRKDETQSRMSEVISLEKIKVTEQILLFTFSFKNRTSDSSILQTNLVL